VDRGNLATAGPLIRDQFALSNTQLGLLLSAFFWSYAPGQLPAGWLAERLDARRVLAVGLAVWGVATALTGLASGFMMLLVLRVMLGLGESVMYPASFKILAREALEGQRGRANGFLAAGSDLWAGVRNARRWIDDGVARLAGCFRRAGLRIAALAVAVVENASFSGAAAVARCTG